MDPLLTAHIREPNGYTLDFYTKQGGYGALKKALGDDAGRGHRGREGSRACAAAAARAFRPA